jgi:hypothetical protein
MSSSRVRVDGQQPLSPPCSGTHFRLIAEPEKQPRTRQS